MIINQYNDNLKSLILFGSHSRGDNTIDSDIDLLGIDDAQNFTVRNIGKVNFSFYSTEKSLEMCSQGDLFFLHIIREGKCLFNDTFFNELKNSFKFKKSYLREAAVAYYLAQKIIEHSSTISNWIIANKRISWCVRTILIALSAEQRSPIYSKLELSSKLMEIGLENQSTMLLIDAKNFNFENQEILSILAYFLYKYSFLEKELNKKEFYSSGIVHSTLDAILNSIPNQYE
ncbi:nucleotidyltransferase domain-containing protein [Enterobacter hormaechei]|uniref:nucleotidyltransferase domain-containing protein n=1 Tax=Enterobacter hormaechei TaxID=158836 RepID=UPI001BDF82BD|nr:nucleotidyltransferase domain-containing protein [Enterobacter hormaechei]MBT1823450.1 nucleotidyltransferase domain-containing protein [Enterobacter hormaechei]MCP3814218.1 nucleotidyltransferase domain-containing protein [Enterobacter hormaechei]MCP3824536.1 nucleotidyltransferase domain-containing protein [Enterobacter hormaechei]MCW4626038.1 nucleotidyltransferase domain-containing protein [Enterobacter hormaechei]